MTVNLSASPRYRPLSSNCALIFGPGPDAVQCPDPLKSPDTKSHTKSGGQGGPVRGLEVPLKRSRPPKDDARRIKKSCPTSVVSGYPPSRDRSVGGGLGPQDGMLTPYPLAASSVLSANRGPVSDNPTAQQTHSNFSLQ
ncbi:hypothetical protein E2C01_098333 [Portunus trituberculatus]|uniref:Uncharacterized protein n=1 Tax=Portunus trituberculatus TaxID=210409 RepID=A0A5B7KDY4_PORTR|nr:hypothetical protein [Portunus trituberculatus]